MGLRTLIAISCLCYAHGTQVNENIELEQFTAAESKSGRAPYKPIIKDNVAAPSGSRPNNIVYGKGGKAARPTPQAFLSTQAYQPHPTLAYLAPSLKNKQSLNKFKPSVEDSGYDGDSVNTYAQGYKPSPQETAALQKYMQRYASQMLAQKPYDGPKHEPYKKFNPSGPQKYKFVPVYSQESKPSQDNKHYDTVEINTEKYQFQPKSPPKKVFTSYDSSLQPSDYKFTAQDAQLANQVMEEPEKSSWGGSIEPYQYGAMIIDKDSELGKITGYKIPAATSISVGHSIETKEEEKGHHDEHYPHHEPKYEYMYQVHDPEKHNNFGHSEARKGKNTWGRYYVQLPDGRLETVKYWVDKTGYHAEVDFKGEAKHPSHKEYSQHSDKSYSSKAAETANLGGHSESSFSLSDAIPIEEF